MSLNSNAPTNLKFTNMGSLDLNYLIFMEANKIIINLGVSLFHYKLKAVIDICIIPSLITT